jgi:hypothetical protein
VITLQPSPLALLPTPAATRTATDKMSRSAANAGNVSSVVYDVEDLDDDDDERNEGDDEDDDEEEGDDPSGTNIVATARKRNDDADTDTDDETHGHTNVRNSSSQQGDAAENYATPKANNGDATTPNTGTDVNQNGEPIVRRGPRRRYMPRRLWTTDGPTPDVNSESYLIDWLREDDRYRTKWRERASKSGVTKTLLANQFLELLTEKGIKTHRNFKDVVAKVSSFEQSFARVAEVLRSRNMLLTDRIPVEDTELQTTIARLCPRFYDLRPMMSGLPLRKPLEKKPWTPATPRIRKKLSKEKKGHGGANTGNGTDTEAMNDIHDDDIEIPESPPLAPLPPLGLGDPDAAPLPAAATARSRVAGYKSAPRRSRYYEYDSSDDDDTTNFKVKYVVKKRKKKQPSADLVDWTYLREFMEVKKRYMESQAMHTSLSLGVLAAQSQVAQNEAKADLLIRRQMLRDKGVNINEINHVFPLPLS